MSAGTVETYRSVWLTSDIVDDKNNVLVRNATFPIMVKETVTSVQLGPVKIDAREVHVQGQRESYQGRVGVEISRGFGGLAPEGNLRPENEIKLNVQTDYINVD